MEKVKTNTQRICVIAAGIALFVVFTLCLQVPVFENYYLCFGYVAMAIYCYSFGALSGTIVGVLGVVLYCIVISGLRGLPGWALGNAVIGIVLGITFKRTKTLKSKWLQAIINVGAILVSVTIGILVVKSIAENILYAQPFVIRAGKNFYAWAADIVVLMISLPVCMMMDQVARKMFPKLAVNKG